MSQASQTMMKGAAILTFAALFSKILSALYRVPFQNLTGDTGFYIYQQIYPFYGLFIALCTYAFPVMVSSILIERQAERERVLKLLTLFLAGVGLAWFAVLYIGAGLIADFMGDPQLKPLIELSAWPFLLLPVLSAGKGWFQSDGNMVPSAIAQVTEQTIRVIAIIGTAFLLTNAGASLYTVGEGAVIGSIAGVIAGALVLVFFIQKHFFQKKERLSFEKGDMTLLRVLLVRGTAIAMVSMLLVLYQLVDALNVYALLTGYTGDAAQAKVLKGIYDRGQPIVQMGVVAATSLSLAVVPVIASDYERKRFSQVKQKASLAVKAGLVFGAAATVGLISIMNPLNRFLFQNEDGSAVLSVFAAAVFLTSVILTVNAVLQGTGSYHTAAWTAAGSLVLKYGLNVLLVPVYGTGGAAIATVCSLMAVAIVLIVKVYKKIGLRLYKPFYLRLLTGLIVMAAGVTLLLLVWTPETRISSGAASIAAAIIGAYLFFKVSWSRSLFTKEEVGQIPFGRKIDRLFIRIEKGGRSS
ncbi:putative polysaccharide biosynthesis protein [Jeotgalibacillus haloalkalitolerans]|uniref:Polysaccharide biosynthesis protein n=1 Tax=Jeotgalibacillus haloalkalitolerans TaxID=3104292 RepID=A0ABU5KRB8_9BACL|nr:polysaccharide biosynthesis protein [Jeotgalibacillus sp. HH7-29]MDZ5713796.1 polysaccharide biosynthesis protein [Jeotgalibacillus sp. HH7-29]